MQAASTQLETAASLPLVPAPCLCNCAEREHDVTQSGLLEPQGACGDVNRNVMAAPAPWKDRADYLDAERTAEDIANLLAPQAGSYYDVWLDGEKWYSETFEVRAKVELGLVTPFIADLSKCLTTARVMQQTAVHQPFREHYSG